ncbi:MAG: tetratricopeptide repeat protein [Acidobacteriia bacterium]|nr:tetratricopeptide repeat protein [Terriglobia bacterium]
MSTILRVAVFSLMFFSFTFGDLFAQKAISGPQRGIREHIARAQQAVADKQFDSAIRELNAVLVIDSKNVEARGNLGVVQFLEGKYAEASQNLRAALQLQPSLWKAQAILGLCEKAQGRLDSAKTLLEKSVPHMQQEPKLQVRAGLALVELDYQRRDLEKALGVLTLLQNTDPTNADVLYVVYRIHTDLATEARQTLAMVAPDSARMHQLLAQHLINERDAKNAVMQYREALRIDPHLPGAHFELGEAILMDSGTTGGQQDAQREFEAAIAVNPGDAKSECRLGGLFSLRGDTESARKHFLRAAELDPNESEAQVGLGKILMSTGHPEEALPHLLAAVRLDPTNAPAHYRLSQLYRQLGRTSNAEQEIATFKELRKTEERLRSAYAQVYKESGSSQTLNPDIP